MFSRTDHVLGRKMSPDKLKEIEIISSVLSDHNTIRLEIKYKEKTLRNTNIWWLNNMLLNNHWITEEIKEELKKHLETDQNENTSSLKLIGCPKSSSKREVRSNTMLPQETRKISNKQPNLTPKTTRERRANKT